MELANTAKRKRRRTRRSLNEMKKRCNHGISNISEYNGISKNHNAIKSNCFVTLNRPTLFNKAVQSETVTRGHLFNLDKKCINNVNFKKNIKASKQFNIEQDVIDTVSKTTISSDDDIELENTYRHVIKNNNNSGRSMHDSPNIISSSSEEITSCVPNISSPVSQLNFELYDEFMNDMPKCLITSVPELLKNDVMKENKIFLQTKQMEIFEKKNIHNIFQKISGRTQMKNQFVFINKTVETPITSYAAWNQSKQLEPISSGSCSSNSNTSKCLYLTENNSLVQESPEYTFYPHRLNQ